MGSICQTIKQVTTIGMQSNQAILFTSLLGLVTGDIGSAFSSPVAHEFQSPSSSEEVYNNVETSAWNYPNYDYGLLPQGEEDRQDVGSIGGVSVAVLVTVFLAALLGALVAPALSAGMTRVMDLEIEIPEIELPKIADNTIEDDDEDVEIIEARSLKKKSPWMKMAQGALSLLEHKLAKQNIGQD